MTQVRPTRPTPEPVSSDDFEMIEGGVTYTPHAGETVTALRGVRIGDFKLLQALAGLQVDIQALEPEENASTAEQESARMKQLELMVPRMEEIGEVIRARVLTWTWTMPSENGDLVPMPQPKEGGVELLTQEKIRTARRLSPRLSNHREPRRCPIRTSAHRRSPLRSERILRRSPPSWRGIR